MGNSRGPDPAVTDREFLLAIATAYQPALSTTDIADRVDLSQPATSKHLGRIEDAGLVDSDKVGQARIWWITDAGRRQLDSQDTQ
jgi:DNA-binding MarR family transcriptional regulator